MQTTDRGPRGAALLEARTSDQPGAVGARSMLGARGRGERNKQTCWVWCTPKLPCPERGELNVRRRVGGVVVVRTDNSPWR